MSAPKPESIFNDLWIRMPEQNALFSLLEETRQRSPKNVTISTFVWATAGKRLKLRTVLERLAKSVAMARSDMPGGTDPAIYVPDWIDRLVEDPQIRAEANRYFASIRIDRLKI